MTATAQGGARAHQGKTVITDTPGRTVADEEAAGTDVVLYCGFALYAAYRGVQAAVGDFARTCDADTTADRRAAIAAFEQFIGYGDFAARAKKYGLLNACSARLAGRPPLRPIVRGA